ncbi:MAG: hypothetical protein DRN17_07215 [Thermoplasmata archaeon]|nr:MAG: hypothetical protein DRN17_07215 [Thermoplasmata archaeon]
MTFEDLLTDAIYKYTLTSSQNELGEWVTGYSSSSVAINARVMPLTNEERMVIAGLYPNIRLKIYTPYSTIIEPSDLISYNGEMYKVEEVVWDSEKTYKKLMVSKYEL